MNDLKQYIANVIKNVLALITQDEGLLLFSLPKIIPEQGVIIEIGSYKGGATILLAQASIFEGKDKVYTIDPHVRDESITITLGKDNKSELFPLDSLPFFKKNIEKYEVGSHVVPLVISSAQAAKNWNKSISLLWIDGDHAYDMVRRDFLLWEEHLVIGGIIAFHDSKGPDDILHLKGPRKVIKKYLLNSNRFTDIKTVDTITYAKKIKKFNFLQALYSKLVIITIGYKLVLMSIGRKFDRKFDRKIGYLGLFIKKYSPFLYKMLGGKK